MSDTLGRHFCPNAEFSENLVYCKIINEYVDCQGTSEDCDIPETYSNDINPIEMDKDDQMVLIKIKSLLNQLKYLIK